jgi:RNA polymerase sigma factor (TIGR02999 family)
MAERGDVTELLARSRAGDASALDRAIPLVYDELRLMARRYVGRESRGRTIQATELVHEVFIKLSRGSAPDAADRAHLLAIASRAMRQLLVDRARARGAGKRGGGWTPTTLGEALVAGSHGGDTGPEEILALDQALEELEPRQRHIVECRFFGGMEETEISVALGVSERTVRRDWVKARAWLYRRLYPEEAEESGR